MRANAGRDRAEDSVAILVPRGPLLCGPVSRVTTRSLLPYVLCPATRRIEIASSSTGAQTTGKAMTRLHGSFSYERRSQ
jgi:hypothetical protein